MQASFSDLVYAAKKKVTRRDWFLGEIEAITPWSVLVAEIQPLYPKGKDGADRRWMICRNTRRELARYAT